MSDNSGNSAPRVVYWLMGIVLALLALVATFLEQRLGKLEDRIQQHVENETRIEDLREKVNRHHP